MTDFSLLVQPDRGQPARTIHVVHPDRWDEWLVGQPQRVRTAVAANKVTGKAGNRAILPGDAPAKTPDEPADDGDQEAE